MKNRVSIIHPMLSISYIYGPNVNGNLSRDSVVVRVCELCHAAPKKAGHRPKGIHVDDSLREISAAAGHVIPPTSPAST